jgi:spermidine synthase
VLDWHRQGLVPLGLKLTSDPRCRFVEADFFALAGSRTGFDPASPGRRFHAVLLDIDHSPSDLLHRNHAAFYQPPGLRELARHLHDGGVFAQWADGDPDERFTKTLNSVFEQGQAHRVRFSNPLLETESASTVYMARKSSAAKD